MKKQEATRIIRETFESPFDKERFRYFIRNLFNHLDESNNFVYAGNRLLGAGAYQQYFDSIERIGKYEDKDGKRIDALIVRLKKETSLERARTRQRNFIAWYLNRGFGGKFRDAALVAFVSPADDDWRFSLVKMETILDEHGVRDKLSPARRYSFLVGSNEGSHTAQSRLLPVLAKDTEDPTLEELEEAFNIETVTHEFFNRYRDLFLKVKESLDEILRKDCTVQHDFARQGMNTVDFSKKLLGQIVFLYFLQRKGWLGVPGGKNWGEGDRNFLRSLFNRCQQEGRNYFNDYLEYLFYDALNNENRGGLDSSYYRRFGCRIPFLNGGLFESDYNWKETNIVIPNDLFSNQEVTSEGDIGTGILDVFDRFNFTVREDEPLEKEVAVDPEMLGKVFENLLEVKDRKSRGTYYTPREIVHYMCQESLINYLDTAVNTIVPREDVETFVRMGEFAVEHDTRVENKGKETRDYSYKLPESIRRNARIIDDKLADIRICDPAVGSGAFPVGLMMEIVRARNTLTTYLPDKEVRSNYDFKRHAIRNCLYGVDIDPGAVEIARLRLWLSLVVDEESIEQIQPLPNLDYKIVQGNSLLGVEKNLFNVELFKELESLKPLYFGETNVKKKQEYKQRIAQLIREITNDNETFDFEVYFSEVFHEKGGFDVVIGNPPYLESRSPNFPESFKDQLQSATRRRWGTDSRCIARGADLLIYFFEIGLFIINESGTVVLITQNSWLDTLYGKRFQEFLTRHTNVQRIIDSDYKYFDSKAGPNVNTVISIFNGKKADENNIVTFARFHENFDKVSFPPSSLPMLKDRQWVNYVEYGYSNRVLTETKWGILLSTEGNILRLLEILKERGIYLSQIEGHNLSIGQGLNLSREYIIDSSVIEELTFLSDAEIPFMTNADGAPFELNKTERFLIDGSRLNQRQVAQLRSRGIKVFGSNLTTKVEPILILPRGVSRHFCALNEVGAYSASFIDVYDGSGLLETDSTVTLNLWLFLNSSIAWLLREISGRKNLGGGLLKAEAADLNQFPIYFEFNAFSEIADIRSRLRHREALETIEEIDTLEHKRIDEIVCDYLKIPKELRIEIIETLKNKILERYKKSRT